MRMTVGGGNLRGRPRRGQLSIPLERAATAPLAVEDTVLLISFQEYRGAVLPGYERRCSPRQAGSKPFALNTACASAKVRNLSKALQASRLFFEAAPTPAA